MVPLGNAIYRDLIQIALLVGVDYASVAVPRGHRYNSGKSRTTSHPGWDCRAILDAVYGGGRLELPLSGFLINGY